MKCEHCAAEFQPKNPKGRFCSARCRVAAARKTTKPRREAPTNPAPLRPVAPPVQHHEPDPPQPRPVVMAERVSAPNLLASRVAGVLARLPGARNHDQTKPQFRKGTML